VNTPPRCPLRTRSVTDGDDEAKPDLLQEITLQRCQTELQQ
jgi:hypothetical protein